MICLLKETFTLFKILIIQLTEHERNLQYLKHGGFSMLRSKYIANLEKDLFYQLHVEHHNSLKYVIILSLAHIPDTFKR